jgi:hypothetical protein
VLALRRFRVIALAAIACSALRADFSFQEITRAGKRVVHTSTKLVKGNRMQVRTKDLTSVINLEKETITEIDFAKKSYTVVPFAQRKQDLPASSFEVSVKATGQSKKLGVLAAKETILTISDQDKLTVTVDAWTATVPSYDEVRTFYRKLGEKLGYGFDALAPDWARAGLAEADKQLNKLDGAPIQRVIKVTGASGEFEVTIELDDLGSAPADPAKFEAPMGFKKIEPGGSTSPQNPPPTPEAPK